MILANLGETLDKIKWGGIAQKREERTLAKLASSEGVPANL